MVRYNRTENSTDSAFFPLVLDARVLVDIAVFIEQRTDTLRIPWSWSDFTGYIWTNKAFKKRTGVNQQSVNSS